MGRTWCPAPRATESFCESAETVALGEFVDATVMVGVVLVNALVGFIQESKAEAALGALRLMVRAASRRRHDRKARKRPARPPTTTAWKPRASPTSPRPT
jgi:magnesium-transporting ATPase (P-type)